MDRCGNGGGAALAMDGVGGIIGHKRCAAADNGGRMALWRLWFDSVCGGLFCGKREGRAACVTGGSGAAVRHLMGDGAGVLTAVKLPAPWIGDYTGNAGRRDALLCAAKRAKEKAAQSKNSDGQAEGRIGNIIGTW